MRKPSPSQIAGWLSLLAAILILGIWYVLLFVAQPAGAPVFGSAIKTAHYLLFEHDPANHWFVWLAVTPVISIAIGIGYLAGVARSKAVAIALLVSIIAQGGASLFLLNWSLVFFMVLPTYWGYLCVRQA